MLSRGISHGFLASIPLGGQTAPIAGAGFRLAWKYAQKNAKKSLISETINRILPKRRPFCTAVVCCPSKVPSRITSRHQNDTLTTVAKRPRRNSVNPRVYACLCRTSPNSIKKLVKDTRSGHGLGSTI